MKKLMLGLMMAFAVIAEAEVKTNVQIGDLKYELDTEAKTATITGYTGSPKSVDVAEVEYLEQKYIVTSVGEGAFNNCSSLTSVSLPNATTIGGQAFVLCENLTSVSLPNATTIGLAAFADCYSLEKISFPLVASVDDDVFSGCKLLVSASLPKATTIGISAFEGCELLVSVAMMNATTIGKNAFKNCYSLNAIIVSQVMKEKLDADRSFYGISETASIFVPLPEDVVKDAEYVVQEAVVDVKITPSSVILKSGNLVLDKELYEASCAIYDYTPETEPEKPYTPKEEDVKFVPPTSVVVSKESIAAPSAGTVKVEDNKVQLSVTVLKTSDLTAEKKEWGEVTLTADDVKVENGKIVISVPVDSASGFMILQSGDAKVSADGNLEHTGIGPGGTVFPSADKE